MLLAQHRGGTRFCRRDDMLNYSIRCEVVGVCKNRDTMSECPRQRASLCRLEWRRRFVVLQERRQPLYGPITRQLVFERLATMSAHKNQPAQKPIAFTALLGLVFVHF